MKTKVFQSGNSQAVSIPKELQFERLDLEYEIELNGDSITICLVPAPLTNVLSQIAAFSDDFLVESRPEQGEQERDFS
ncbi:MAG: AbrB family transcriptional regulator [Cyanobacteria bacterium P01_H01_bin.15]